MKPTLRYPTPLLLAIALVAGAAHADDRDLLPPEAQPHGYSLADMSQAIALLATSGFDPQYLPDTPFQILYADWQATTWDFSGGGLTVISSNHFDVRAGTMFYLPVFNVDNSPPEIGTFPSTQEGAAPYFFDPAAVGGEFEIIIDGRTIDQLQSYVVGPVITPPLLNGGGTRMITLGAFLAPLAPGRHVVVIRGAAAGQGVMDTYGLAFYGEDIAYTIDVGP